MQSTRPQASRRRPLWSALPRGHEPWVLLRELTRLYWLGVERDLHDIMSALQLWSRDRYVGILQSALGPQNDAGAEWSGFETFVTRAAGVKDEELMRRIGQEAASRNHDGEDMVKERLAALLLDSAGFLDIDKVAEYRKPEYRSAMWLRPRAAQLKLASTTPADVDFQVQYCSNCGSAIRGGRFCCVENCTTETPKAKKVNSELSPVVLCESCARGTVHPQDHLKKTHKNCIVPTAVATSGGRPLTCVCPRAAHIHRSGASADPTTATFVGLHDLGCPLLQLALRHCRAKLRELQITKSLHRPLPSGVDTSHQPENGKKKGIVSRFVRSVKRTVARPIAKTAARDIPYGNVHMSLMMGPLVIENGAAEFQEGAMISVRDQLQFLPVADIGRVVHCRLGLRESKLSDPVIRRQLLRTNMPVNQRRPKAFMKQVVGGIFSSFRHRDRSLGHETVSQLVCESERCIYDPMKSERFNERRRNRAVGVILRLLKTLLWDRLRVYLLALVNRLMHPEVGLKWDIFNNHCQRFVESLIDRRLFSSLLADLPTPQPRHPQPAKPDRTSQPRPLYLFSFVTRYGCHDGFPRPVVPRVKAAAPNGWTEEYLLRYRRYGHHTDSDIVDTLAEYWTDWAVFESPPFEHMDLFPWDCTEAYTGGQTHAGRKPPKCGRCNIAKHLWAFPFDSWSVVQLHLFRERKHYVPEAGAAWDAGDANVRESGGGPGSVMSDLNWASNRLRLLCGLHALNTVAVALSSVPAFRDNCRWLRPASGPIHFPFAGKTAWHSTHPGGTVNSSRRSSIIAARRKGIEDAKLRPWQTTPQPQPHPEPNPAVGGRTPTSIRSKYHHQPNPNTVPETSNTPATQSPSGRPLAPADRAKLAGIHRAQPLSHAFEHGRLHDCTLAPWVGLPQRDALRAYLRMRDGRAAWEVGEWGLLPRMGPTGMQLPRVRLERNTGDLGAGYRVKESDGGGQGGAAAGQVVDGLDLDGGSVYDAAVEERGDSHDALFDFYYDYSGVIGEFDSLEASDGAAVYYGDSLTPDAGDVDPVYDGTEGLDYGGDLMLDDDPYSRDDPCSAVDGACSCIVYDRSWVNWDPQDYSQDRGLNGWQDQSGGRDGNSNDDLASGDVDDDVDGGLGDQYGDGFEDGLDAEFYGGLDSGFDGGFDGGYDSRF